METEAASLKRKSEGEAELEEAPQKQQKRDNGWASVDDEAVACLHDVSYPEGYVVPPPSSSSSAAAEASEPAKKFPFPLDPFQSEAINCLEKAESVMVCKFVAGFFFFLSIETFSIEFILIESF